MRFVLLPTRLLKNSNGHVDDESFNHIGLTVNRITVVLHSTPGFMANFVYNRRLQRWLNQKVDEQCSNMVALPNDAGLVAVPTHSFNIVYQLYHLYPILSMGDYILRYPQHKVAKYVNLVRLQNKSSISPL